MTEAAVLEKVTNLNQLHLQIILIERDYILFSISWDTGI